MGVGDRIAVFRKEQGLSQAEMGQILGIQNKTVSAIETGRIQITSEALLKLSELYDLSSTWVLTGKGEMYIDQNKNREQLNEEIKEMMNIIENFMSRWKSGEIQPTAINKKTAKLFLTLLKQIEE